MSEARELLKSIQPLRFIINPFTFVTFWVNTTGLSISRKGTIAGFCIFSPFFLYKASLVLRSPGENFEGHVDNYSELILMILFFLSFSSYIVNSRGIVRALNQLTAKAVPGPDKNFYKYVNRGTTTQVLICYVIPFIYTASLFYWNVLNDFDEVSENYLDFLTSICFSYLFCVHFATTSVIFGNSILLCRRIIRKVNQQLEEMDRLDDQKPDALFEFINKKSGHNRISVVMSNDSLVTVIQIYDLVCQWCVDFNELLGIPLATCCIAALVNIILYSYYLTKYGIANLWMIVLGIFHFILQTWFILRACEKCTKEVRNTGRIVNRLIIHGKNQKRKELLQQFSIMILHRKIKFSACGMFSLDYSLMYSALATMAGYLAIAYQFEMASRQSSQNSTGNKTQNYS